MTTRDRGVNQHCPRGTRNNPHTPISAQTNRDVRTHRRVCTCTESAPWSDVHNCTLIKTDTMHTETMLSRVFPITLDSDVRLHTSFCTLTQILKLAIINWHTGAQGPFNTRWPSVEDISFFVQVIYGALFSTLTAAKCSKSSVVISLNFWLKTSSNRGMLCACFDQ